MGGGPINIPDSCIIQGMMPGCWAAGPWKLCRVSFQYFCLFFVCHRDYTKTTDPIFLKLGGGVGEQTKEEIDTGFFEQTQIMRQIQDFFYFILFFYYFFLDVFINFPLNNFNNFLAAVWSKRTPQTCDHQRAAESVGIQKGTNIVLEVATFGAVKRAVRPQWRYVLY